jgi:hypothetical protein
VSFLNKKTIPESSDDSLSSQFALLKSSVIELKLELELNIENIKSFLLNKLL